MVPGIPFRKIHLQTGNPTGPLLWVRAKWWRVRSLIKKYTVVGRGGRTVLGSTPRLSRWHRNENFIMCRFSTICGSRFRNLAETIRDIHSFNAENTSPGIGQGCRPSFHSFVKVMIVMIGVYIPKLMWTFANVLLQTTIEICLFEVPGRGTVQYGPNLDQSERRAPKEWT